MAEREGRRSYAEVTGEDKLAACLSCPLGYIPASLKVTP